MKERLERLRKESDNAAVQSSLARIRQAAAADENLVPLFIDAVTNLATIGEIADVLREVFGVYRPELAAIY